MHREKMGICQPRREAWDRSFSLMYLSKVAFIMWHYTMENGQFALEKPQLPDLGFKVGVFMGFGEIGIWKHEWGKF